MYLLDASVAVRWFAKQPGYEAAEAWLVRYVDDSDLFVAPDLIRFEVCGALARLQQRGDKKWCKDSVDRFFSLGIHTLPTTTDLFNRAIDLAREIPMGSYDAIYLAHAEDLGIPWLTGDERALRRFDGDKHVHPMLRVD